MEENDSILEDIRPEETEAPYLQRLLTNAIDWVIEILLLLAFYFLLPRELIFRLFDMNPYMKYVIALGIVFLYRLLSIFLFERTVGMMLCGTKYLNRRLLPLSSGEKLISVFIRNANIRYYKV